MTRLIADDFYQDPAFQHAKQTLLETLEKHRSKISAVKPPQNALIQSYEETLKSFQESRGLPLFFPYLGSGIGNGALVELADGSVKYDFISGIGTHWGHSHPKLISAALDAACEDIVMQGNLQQNLDSVDLIELLIQHSGMDHCFLSTSGAIANENALKIIFQKKSPAYRILAFDRCFIGRTLALSQITDRPAFREGLPHILSVDYVPFYDWRNPMESTEKTLNAIQTHLQRYPKEYACMCFEMIQGESGSFPGTHEFFVSVIKLLKEHSIAIFIDEVQTFGRTDRLFAFQHFGLEEYVDVATCGKLLHTCATLYKSSFLPKPGLISQTYTSASSSIRVAYAIVKSLLEGGYFGLRGKNMQIRKRFVEHLQKLAEKYPKKIEGPFGHGLMIAFTPFRGEREKVSSFAKALFEAGLITYISGVSPARIRFLVPAGGITDQDIDHAMAILENTLVKMDG